MNWWNNPEIKKMYAVGQPTINLAIDGQPNSWMLEGIFETEQEAITNCTHDDYFVTPIPIGLCIGAEIPDGMFWPRLQSKEEGQQRIELFRKGKLNEN